jgi:hypothetical protein
MNTECTNRNGRAIALVDGVDGVVIKDAQSALDLLVAARYEAGAERMAIAKELVSDDFFVLSSGLAGEILQKYVNYQMKLAIYGDFSGYTSKPLHDFIYESNKGRDFFFVGTREEAIERLAEVQ